MPDVDNCLKIRLLGAGQSVVLLTDALTVTGHPAMTAAAHLADPIPDARLIFLAEGDPATSRAGELLRSQPMRDQLVVVPWDLIEQGADPARAEGLVDRYQTQIQLPAPGFVMPADQVSAARMVPVDAQGRETSADAAVAVRVLPWSHVAARTAMQVAAGLIEDGSMPSPARLEQYLSTMAALAGRIPGEIPADALAAGAYLARYGVPPGQDLTRFTGSPMPATAKDVFTLAGGTPSAIGEGRVLAELSSRPGSVALVSYLPDRAQPPRLAMLTDNGDGVRWYEPGALDGPATHLDTTGISRLGAPGTTVLMLDPAAGIVDPVMPAPQPVEQTPVPPVEQTPETAVSDTTSSGLTEADPRLAEVGAALGVDPGRLDWVLPVLNRIDAAPVSAPPGTRELAGMLREYAAAHGTTVEAMATLPVTADALPLLTHLLDRGVLTDSPDHDELAAAIDRIAEVRAADGLSESTTRILDGAWDMVLALTAPEVLSAADGGRDVVTAVLDAIPETGPPAEAVRSLRTALERAAADGARTGTADWVRLAQSAIAVATGLGVPEAELLQTVSEALEDGLAARQRIDAGMPGTDGKTLLRDFADGLAPELRAELRSERTAALEADRVLAPWWADRLGVPVEQLAPGLGRSGWVDPSLLMRLASGGGQAPSEIFAQVRRSTSMPVHVAVPQLRTAASTSTLTNMLASEMNVSVPSLAPLLPFLESGGPASISRLVASVDQALTGLDHVFEAFGGREPRLDFLADRGLTVHDIADQELIRAEAQRWLAELLGVDVDLARTAAAQSWFNAESVVEILQSQAGAHGWRTEEIFDLANELGVDDAWLLGFGLRTGRIPDDLADLAKQWGVHSPAQLLRLSSELGADPAELESVSGLLDQLNNPDDPRGAVSRTAEAVRDSGWQSEGHLSPVAAILERALLLGRSPAELSALDSSYSNLEPIHAGLMLPWPAMTQDARRAAQTLWSFDGYLTLVARLDPETGDLLGEHGPVSVEDLDEELTALGVSRQTPLALVICEVVDESAGQSFADRLQEVRPNANVGANAVNWILPGGAGDVVLGGLHLDADGRPTLVDGQQFRLLTPGGPALGSSLKDAMATLGIEGVPPAREPAFPVREPQHLMNSPATVGTPPDAGVTMASAEIRQRLRQEQSRLTDRTTDLNRATATAATALTNRDQAQAAHDTLRNRFLDLRDNLYPAAQAEQTHREGARDTHRTGALATAERAVTRETGRVTALQKTVKDTGTGLTTAENARPALVTAAAGPPDAAGTADAAKQLTALDARIGQLNRDLTEQRRQLTAAEIAAARAATDLTTARTEQTRLEQSVSAQEAVVEALEDEIEALQKSGPAATAALNSRNADLTRDEGLRDGAQKLRDQQQRVVDGWQARRSGQADLTDMTADGVVPIGSLATVGDANAQLVHTATMQALTAFWAAHPGLAGSTAEQQAIRDAAAERVTADMLEHHLSAISSPGGSPDVLGDKNPLRVTWYAALNEPSTGPAVTDDAQAAATQTEVNATLTAAIEVKQAGQTNRDVNIPVTGVVGLGKSAGILRTFNVVGGPQATWNQYVRDFTVSQGSKHVNVIRGREPHVPHLYTPQWRVMVAPAADVPPAANGRRQPATPAGAVDQVAAGTTPVTVLLPKHLAQPTGPVSTLPGTEKARIDRMAEEHLVVLDALQNPGNIEHELRTRIPDLNKLNAASLRELTRFTDQYDLQGGLHRMRRAGLRSEPLYDTDGKFAGILRLKAELVPVRKLTEAPLSKMKVQRFNPTGVKGAGGLRNAGEFGIGPGGTLTGTPFEQTGKYGDYSTGVPSGQARAGVSTVNTLNTGGTASMLRGWETGNDTNGVMHNSEVDGVDLRYTATLIRPGANAQASWHGQAARHTGGWVRRVPLRMSAANPALHPPAEVEWGGTGTTGHADITDLEITGGNPGESIQDRVREWLLDKGYLAKDPKKATERQAANLERLETANDPDHLETNFDELDGNGLWTTFEREGPANTIQRVTLKMSAVRYVAGMPNAEHLGASGTASMLFGSTGDANLTSKRTLGGVLGLRAGVDVTPGIDEGIFRALPFSIGPYQYQRAYTRDSVTGAVFDQGTVIIAPTEPVHGFKIQRLLSAEIYEPTKNQPVWQYSRPGTTTPIRHQILTARAWVPDILVSRNGVAANPVHRTPVPVTEEHAAGLSRPADQQYGQLIGTTTVAGSTALNRLFTELATLVYSPPKPEVAAVAIGPSPASHASLSAASRRAFVSPAKLRDKLWQMLTGAYVSEHLQETGAVSQAEGAMVLQAYPGLPRFVPPPPDATGARPARRGYSEHSTGVTQTSAEGDGVGRTHQFDGSGAPAFAIGDFTLNPTGGGRYGSVSSASESLSADVSETRTQTRVGPIYTLYLPLTFVGSISGGWQNVITSTVGKFKDLSAQGARAVQVDDAVQTHLHFGELAELWRARGKIVDAQQRAADAARKAGKAVRTVEERITGLPADLITALDAEVARMEADEKIRWANNTPERDDVRYLPRRIFSRWGLGEAVVMRVTETGRPAVVTPPGPTLQPATQTTDAQAGQLGLGSSSGPTFELGTTSRTPGGVTSGGVPAGGAPAATEPAPAKAHRALYDSGLAAAHKVVPALIKPGSSTYMPGVWEAIADLSSPAVLDSAMLRYLSAGTTAGGPIRLAARPITATRDAGRIDGYVELIAQPAPGFSTTDQLRQMPGFLRKSKDSGTPGVETHTNTVRNHNVGAGRSYVKGGAGGLRVLSPGRQAEVRWHNPSLIARINSRTDAMAARDDKAENKGTTRHEGDMAEFSVPVQLALRVVSAPVSGLNYVGPKIGEILRGKDSANLSWVDATAELRVPEEETTPKPLRAAPPSWYRAPEILTADPLAAGATRAAYTAPPEVERVSFFDGVNALTQVVKTVMVKTAGSPTGALRVENYVGGMTGEASARRFMIPGGVSHEFTYGDAADPLERMERLTITPIEVEALRTSTDVLSDGTPVTVGEGSKASLEGPKVRSMKTTAAAGKTRTLGLNGELGVNPYVQRDQVNPAIPNAPGNFSTAQVNYFTVEPTGGPRLAGSSQQTAAGMHAERQPGVSMKLPNVLAHRRVLFHVQAEQLSRRRGGTEWTVNGTHQRWLRATVEGKISSTLLPTVPPPPVPGPSGQNVVQVNMLRAVQTGGPQYHDLVNRPLAELDRTLVGITYDYQDGYGEELREALGKLADDGDQDAVIARQLFTGLGDALTRMRATLADPRATALAKRAQFHDMLLAFDQAHTMAGPITAMSPVRVPSVRQLVTMWTDPPPYLTAPDPAVTDWLAENDITGWVADRLGAPMLGLDTDRLDLLGDSLGLDENGTQTLYRVTAALGQVPDDVSDVALGLGVEPGPFYALVRDLVVTPAELVPFADELREVLGSATEIDPVGESWASRLREHLAGAGVSTEHDLTTLVEMTNRLGLTAGERALVGDLASDGVSLHLLRELPAALIRSALAAVGARREHDAGAYARSLGMSRPEALVTAAEILEVSTAGLQHVLGAHPELTAGFTPAPLPAGVDSSADNLRRQAVEHGTALAGHIRSALGAAGLEGPALDQWIRWTARLGFDVQNLSEILPGPLAQQSTYISRLIGAALHDERPDTVRNLLQEVLPVRGPAGLVDGDLKEQIRATALAGPEADDLARDLRVPPRILDQLGTVPTVNPHDLRALVRQTGLSGRETGVLIDLAARTGHLPEARDLLRLSARTGWSPGRLLDLARALDVDPALLWPLRDVLERVDSLPEGDVYRPTPAQVAGSVREYLDLTPGGMSADGWLWLAGQGRGPHGFTLSGLRHLRKGTQAMQQPLADYLTAQTKTAARVIADVTATVGAAQQRLVGTGSPADREVLNRAFAVAASARGLTSRDEATRVQQVRLMGAAALRTAEKAGVRREDTEQLLDRLGGLNDAGRGPQSGRVVSAAVEAAHLTAHSVRTALRSAGPNERLHASVLAHQFERLASALTRHLNAEYRLLDHAAADWTGLVGRYLTPDTDGSVFRAPPGNQADQLLASWWSDRLGIATAHVREILAQVPTLDLAKVRSAAQAFDVPVQTVLGHVSRDALWLAGVEQYIEGARQGNAKQRALRIVYDTSTITQIQPQWTLRLVGSLWESTDARDVALLGDPAALAGHLRTALLGFGGALPRELPIRAAFLTDLRLDLTDLPGRGDHTGRAELAEQTELWRATTLGLTTAEYRAVRSLDWFSGDRWSDLLDELREDAAERNPGEHWDDDTMFRLAEQFDVSMLWLNGFAHRIGRMPADLPVLAEQWGIDDAGRLFALAVELDVDPRDLVTAWPERIGALVEGRDPEPVLAAREQWREQAIEALKDALNDEEIDRDAAVAQAVENLRDLDWTAPPPRTSLPGALLAIATATRRIPEDLLVRSASANLVPADLIMATRLASTDGPVDPAAIVAYVLAAGPAAAPVLDDPARLADAYRTWADTLQRDLGIAPAEISRLHDQARTINLTLTDVAAGDQPRQLVENLRAAAFPNAYMRTMIEIFTSSFTSTNVFDHARALERFTRFTEQVAAAGRAYPPLMPSLELDLTATLEFRIHDGADTLRESVPRAVAIPADGRSGSLTLTADQPDWRALSAVQSAMASAAVEVDRIQVRTSSGTYQVEGFADLAPAEAMTLIATLAMDGGDLTAAVRTLGWDTRVTNAGSGPAITTLTRRPLDVMPSPEAFEAFRAHEVAALAMLTVASGHRIANLIADPDAETPAAAVPEEAETPAVRQPGNPMPDGWVNHGNLQPVTVDTLARAVRGSAARMGLPMAAGVTSGPALIAHAADQLDSGRSTLPGVLESAAEMLTGKMSPESRALLGSTVGDLQHIGLPPVGMDVITWALIRGDLPTMQYVETYYDENPGAPAERLARRFVAAARAGTPLTSEQALAEFLRDPQIRAGLPASVVGPVLAHTLGVNLVQVAANGTTTTVPGPENARDLYVRVTPRGVAQVGPPLPDLSPGSLKAGQDAWFSQHLAVVGAQRSWSGKSALLDTVVRESAVFAGEGRAVVVIDGDSLTRVGAGLVRDDPEAAPDPARDSIELTTLGALIRQLRGDADGEDDGPVVVSTGAPGALTELLSDLGVPLIVRVPSGLDQVWQVRDPSGTVLHEANELGSEHFVRAPKSNTAVEADPDALRELEEWTRASSWTDAEQHLSSNLDVLLGDEVADALQVLLEADGQNRELGAYEVVLDLARDADGLGTPAQQALAPAAETVGAGDGGAERPAPEGPLSPVFALRYLERKATYEQRGAWNDQLLGLLYQGRLTAAQTVALARGVLAPEGSTTGPDRALTNARVFHGVGVVLEQTPEQAARGESDEAYRRALQLVEDCVVVPDDRWKFILRLNRLTQRLTRHGLPGRFDAEQAAGHIANLRLLTEKFSNC